MCVAEGDAGSRAFQVSTPPVKSPVVIGKAGPWGETILSHVLVTSLKSRFAENRVGASDHEKDGRQSRGSLPAGR